MKRRAIKYLLRARFGEIVAEFLPPARRAGGKPSRRVIIYCPGAPTSPSSRSLVEFLSRKGFWCFSIRYRGSWESGGRFLKISPERDVLEVVKRLPRGVRDIYGGRTYRVRPSAVYVFGSSFGGPAAILASRDRRIARAVAISPVIDWRTVSRKESVDWTARFAKEAFGEAYRGSRSDWMKLKSGRFYNPAAEERRVRGAKLFLFHAKDDRVVPYRGTVKFAKATGAELMLLSHGGHLGASFVAEPAIWRRVSRFLRRAPAP